MAPNTRTLTRAHLRQARDNDPVRIFAAAKRLARRALVHRGRGDESIVKAALHHAKQALDRALLLRGMMQTTDD